MALWQGISNLEFAAYSAIASNRLLYLGRGLSLLGIMLSSEIELML